MTGEPRGKKPLPSEPTGPWTANGPTWNAARRNRPYGRRQEPSGVRGMIIRVSDQLRCGEISLFEKDPEEAEAAKARLEAERAQRRKRYATRRGGVRVPQTQEEKLAKRRERRTRDKDRINAQAREKYEKNKHQINARRQERRSKNRDHINALERARYARKKLPKAE